MIPYVFLSFFLYIPCLSAAAPASLRLPSRLISSKGEERQGEKQEEKKGRGLRKLTSGASKQAHQKPAPATDEERRKRDVADDESWREKFGAEAARVIRRTVDKNVADYEYLKGFALKV